MSTPPNEAPLVLKQVSAAAKPLSDSSPDTPVVAASNSDNNTTGSAAETDDAQNTLASLPNETETTETIVAAVAAGGSISLATIYELPNCSSSNEELPTGNNASNKSTTTEGLQDQAQGHHTSTETVADHLSADSESGVTKTDDHEPATAIKPHIDPDESEDQIKTPETAKTASPTMEVPKEGGDVLDNGSPKASASAFAANDPAEEFVDPHDKDNIGNVIKFFYTSSTRKRPSSPVAAAPGCCNPRLHHDSDLYIKAKDEGGETCYVFEVVSATLEKASIKFEAMIYGSHTRGNKEVWVWELNDDPLALRIMFCLVHNKFPRAFVSSKPNTHQLHKMLQVLEKYEVNLEDTNYHLFAPSWIDGFRNGLATSKLTNAEALRVAYKIGDLKTTKTLIRECANEIADEDGLRLQDFPMQQRDIVDSIENIRNDSLERLLSALKVPLEYFMDAANFHGNQYCKSNEGHFECNQKLLGSLMANLVQQSLFPIPEPANYRGSVAGLIEKMEKMEIRGLFYPGIVMTEQKHTPCKLGQAVAVEEARGNDGKGLLPLSDNLLEHMYFACKRNGLLRKEQREFEPYKARVRDFELLYRDEFKKDIWGWYDMDAPEGNAACDGSDDSGIFDVIDNSTWVERKVSG